LPQKPEIEHYLVSSTYVLGEWFRHFRSLEIYKAKPWLWVELFLKVKLNWEQDVGLFSVYYLKLNFNTFLLLCIYIHRDQFCKSTIAYTL